MSCPCALLCYSLPFILLHVFFTNFDILALEHLVIFRRRRWTWHKCNSFVPSNFSIRASLFLYLESFLGPTPYNLNYFPPYVIVFLKLCCYCTSCPFTIIHWLFLICLACQKGYSRLNCACRDLTMTLNPSLFGGCCVIDLTFVLFWGLVFCVLDLWSPDYEVIAFLASHLPFAAISPCN